METEIIIGTEKVERIHDEQYRITPINSPFYTGDDGLPYEIVIEYNGEEWVCGAWIIKSDNIDDVEYESLESEDRPGIYLSMLPEIRQRFGDE